MGSDAGSRIAKISFEQQQSQQRHFKSFEIRSPQCSHLDQERIGIAAAQYLGCHSWLEPEPTVFERPKYLQCSVYASIGFGPAPTGIH